VQSMVKRKASCRVAAWDAGFVDDQLWKAVTDALAGVSSLEPNGERLEWRIVQYFRRAYKGISFGEKTCPDLINEYADKVFNLLFQALSDCEWLMKTDFVLVLDVAIKESFPSKVLDQLSGEEFERVVLAAHDRAFEEARFLPKCWELVQNLVPREGRSCRKVYDAMDHGRKVAGQLSFHDDDPNLVKEFVSKWADHAIWHLAQHCDPFLVLPEEAAVQLFHSVIEAGTLPVPLVTVHGQPPVPWPFIDYAVQAAFTAHCGCRSNVGKGGRPWPSGRPAERPLLLPAKKPAGVHIATAEAKEEVCDVSSVEAKEEQLDAEPEG